jgi:uncharacterized integral membrane protein
MSEKNKNYKKFIMDKIVFIVVINIFYLINTYKATGFKLNFWTFLHIIALIVLDFLFFVLPYKLQKNK